jgi:hypothetical protein
MRVDPAKGEALPAAILKDLRAGGRIVCPARPATPSWFLIEDFVSFADAARRYIEVASQDQFVRRDVANAVNGLTELLRLERKRMPGRVLSEADRLECLFFGGFDPHFEGDEPPNL